MNNNYNNRKGFGDVPNLLVMAGVIVFVLTMPILNKGYKMLCLNLTLIYSLVTLSISVMLGMGGQMSFAGVAMMGVGGFFTANLCTGRLGILLPTFPVLLITPIFSAAVAFLLGLILLRLKRIYFTFATIAVVQVAWSFYSMYKPLFGGYNGISGVPSLAIFGYTPANYGEWFYILSIVVLIVSLLVQRIRTTRLGRSLAAIRDDEVAAASLGINVYMTKVIAFTIAGAICGLAGGLYALHTKYVSADMFTFAVGVQYIIMAMLGGVNSTLGCVVGSVLIGMLREWLRVAQGYINLLYGIGVILLMVFMPMGLADLVGRVAKIIRKKLIVKTKDNARETGVL